MRFRLFLPLLLLGCPEPEPDSVCASGVKETWVMCSMTFARRVDDRVGGFVIDSHDSGESGDSTGCGHADFVSPEGASGVDNNFSILVPILETSEAVAAESLLMQSIAAGELLITFTVDGSEWEDDSDQCADFVLGRAHGDPLVGPDGILLDLQTLDPDPSVADVQTVADVDNDTLLATDLEFRLPLDVLNAELDFRVTRGMLSLQRNEDGTLTGQLGGVIPVSQIVEILVRDDVNLSDFVPIVEGLADVADENGDCTLLSLGFNLQALPVFLVEPN